MGILKLFLISILLIGVRCQEGGFGSYEFDSFEENREIVEKEGQVLPYGISIKDLKTDVTKAIAQLVGEFIVQDLQQNWSIPSLKTELINSFVAEHICINATNNPLQFAFLGLDFIFQMNSDLEIKGLNLVNASVDYSLEEDGDLGTIWLSYTIEVPLLKVLGDFSWRVEQLGADGPMILFEMATTESELIVTNSTFELFIKTDALLMNEAITFEQVSLNYNRVSSWLADWKICIIAEAENGGFECRSIFDPEQEQPIDLSPIVDSFIDMYLPLITSISKTYLNIWFENCTLLDFKSGSLDCISYIPTNVKKLREKNEKWTMGYQECPAEITDPDTPGTDTTNGSSGTTSDNPETTPNDSSDNPETTTKDSSDNPETTSKEEATTAGGLNAISNTILVLFLSSFPVFY